MIRMQQMDARDAAATKLKVVVVQANVGAGDKHDKADEALKVSTMTNAALGSPTVGLVVWPESGFTRSSNSAPILRVTSRIT